mmetsp:Transcript_31009/g.90421  ORF Transcript_31009/g.90421 Transcript_31009/m.90421 type:complete len:86 (+) Transcript_31009:64-321(+)
MCRHMTSSSTMDGGSTQHFQRCPTGGSMLSWGRALRLYSALAKPATKFSQKMCSRLRIGCVRNRFWCCALILHRPERLLIEHASL